MQSGRVVQAVVARFLDLDHRAAGGGQFAQLGVHDVAEIDNQRLVVGVVLVPQHPGEGRGADGPELHRAVGEALGDLPERGELQRRRGVSFSVTTAG